MASPDDSPAVPGPDEGEAAGRLAHFQRLREQGLPTRFERTHLASDLHREFAELAPGTETDSRAVVAGRLREDA